MSSIEGTDRYGGEENWPDPETICPGQCEGTGTVPVPPHGYPIDLNDTAQWEFVSCPDCKGTGKRND